MRAFLIALILFPSTALAFEPVTDRATFLSLVQGKRLTGDGVGLVVTSDGAIAGRGFGFRVTGRWDWEGGYFCRTLNSAIRDFPRNCQTVAVQGDVLRFQADRGTGDVADLTLR
ncbi:dihydrodipicolinate reductase [Jannaschia marina]|uniref:dihydrodipicolinate reductase n=1 Tax=Jannaschia marina TaxID=2741674 RepID=UPI0015CDC8F8|nr:dihydrodipicolinate reductase [Jannaschia marina]